MLTERERERGDTVRDIVRLLYRGNDSRREERYSKDRRSEGTRFRPRAGMIDRTRFRAIVSPRRDSHAKRARYYGSSDIFVKWDDAW